MSIVMVGSTSGSITLQEPAVAGTTVIDLPATSGTMVVTGGAQTVQFAAGSASTPSITFTGDTNTGIFSPGADTIAFTEGGTESMRIDSSGNVGIGTSSPVSKLQVADTTATRLTISKAANSITNNEELGSILWRINGGAGTVMGNIYYTGNANSSSDGTGALVFGARGNNNATTLVESMRITSDGDLFINTTASLGGGKLTVSSTSRAAGFFTNASGGTQDVVNIANQANAAYSAIRFWVNGRPDVGSLIGSISCTTSATAYNTSSDYRLKENIAPMTGALAKVAQLKPCTYTWKVDGSDGQGFIAHELAEVVPDCVTGEKDAVETYTDEDGNEHTRIKPQGVDTSFLVATLTAALQEQQAIITDLKARIETLENK